MIYYLVLLVGFLLIIKNGDKKKSLYLFAFILLLLAAFRYGVGADYFSYRELYSKINPNIINEALHGYYSHEVLYRLIGSCIKGIGINYQIYLVILSIINLYFISKLCIKNSKNPILSLVVYYCFYYFVWTYSSLRQGTALAIGLYFLVEAIKKKFDYRFVLLTLILSLIHTSALVLIFLYLLSYLDFSKNQLIIIVGISIVISFMPLGNIVEHFIDSPLFNRIASYITNSNTLGTFLSFKNVGRLFFLGFAFYHYDRYILSYPEKKKVMNLYILSLSLYFVFKFSELTAARLSIYGKMLDIILIPNIYYLYSERTKQKVVAMLISIICILYLSKELIGLKVESGLITDKKYLVPYTNIFNKDQYKFDKRYSD